MIAADCLQIHASPTHRRTSIASVALQHRFACYNRHCDPRRCASMYVNQQQALLRTLVFSPIMPQVSTVSSSRACASVPLAGLVPRARLHCAPSAATMACASHRTVAPATVAGRAYRARCVCCELLLFEAADVTCSSDSCASSCNNGQCAGPNTCSCNAGWSGSDCLTRLCLLASSLTQLDQLSVRLSAAMEARAPRQAHVDAPRSGAAPPARPVCMLLHVSTPFSQLQLCVTHHARMALASASTSLTTPV